MDDGLILFLVLVLLAILLAGVVSFFLVLATRSRLALLERGALRIDTPDLRLLNERIAALERRVAAFGTPGQAPPAATPKTDAPPPAPGETAPAAAQPPEPEATQSPEPEPEPHFVQATSSPSSAPPEPAIPAPPPAPPPTPRPARPDLETRLGARWTVWVGGLALALGGVFLVRYSIEQGLLGPLGRVIGGGVFAVLLLAAGEYLRRGGEDPMGPDAPLVSIPGILTAAGTMTAFAAIYAAFALYDLLPPAAAFLLMGLVALATMLAAVLHGPSLAALGLVGALVVPLLIGGSAGDAWPLVPYFAAVSFASFGVARWRRWQWLAMAAIAGAAIWAILLGEEPPVLSAARVHLALQFALAVLFLIAGPFWGVPDAEARLDRLSQVLLAVFTAVTIVSLLQDATPAPRFAGLMAVLALGTGIFFAPAAGAVVMAGAVVLCALAVWPATAPLFVEGEVVQPLQPPDLSHATQSFLHFALLAALVIAGVSAWRLWRGRMLPLATAAAYAAAAAATPVLALLIVWWRTVNFNLSPSLAIAAGLLAAAYALALGLFMQDGRNRSPALALAAEAMAAAAIAALALGLTIGLERANLTLALALAATGAAWVTTRGPLNSLRLAVGALGLAVLARLAWDPDVTGGALIGTLPLGNRLAIGYGGPALAFFVAAHLLRERAEDWPLRLCEGLTVLFVALLGMFEIRNLLNDGDLLAPTTDHIELGLHVTLMLGIAAVLLWLQTEAPNPVYRWGSRVFGLVGLLIGFAGLCFDYNPLFGGRVIGGDWINSLLLGYAAPGLAALVLAGLALARRAMLVARVAAVFSLLLLLLFVSLEARRFFQGPEIDLGRGFGDAELWSYSALWLVAGIGLLAAGLATGSRLMRIASAVLILATVAKAFLIDMSGLEGVWRAASFIGLGVVLIGIGLIYQRLLRRQPVSG